MQDFLSDYYLTIKALHVISIICWMVGLLYLPRLFVYHSQVATSSETSDIFKVMERRLTRAIMTPAMIASFLFGILLIIADPGLFSQGWFHVKLTAVLLMAGAHGMMARSMKQFQKDQNVHRHLYFRIMNEAPTLLMLIIVIMVIIKPF